MDNDHKTRVLRVISALSEAKIYAGAEFEALCNEGDYKTAYMFEMLRDVLNAQRIIVSDFITTEKDKEEGAE